MNQAISYLSVLPTTAAERATFVARAIDEIASGERNPLEIQVILTSMEKLVAEIRKSDRVRETVLLEIHRWPAGKATINGIEISTQDRRTYDFTHCQDVEWERLDSEIKALTERKKERELFLKSLPAPMVDPETSVLIQPPLWYDDEIIKVKERRSK